MIKKLLISVGVLVVLLTLYVSSAFVPALFYDKDYSQQQLRHMKIIGHRGGASLAPENTMTCYRKGIEAGADMIEIDIHLSKDGRVVVCHDQTVDRTTNGTGKIRELTLAEIQRLRVVDANGHLTDEHLPTLEEVFALMQDVRSKGNPCELLVEIKRTHNIYQGIEEKLLQQIADNQAREWVTVQSFNDFALEKIHQLDSGIRLEKLIFCKLPGLPVIIDGLHLTTFNFRKYDYISSFNFQYHGIWKSLLDDIHAHGKEVKIWTLEGLDAPRLDVDGIITNRPDLWAERRGSTL